MKKYVKIISKELKIYYVDVKHDSAFAASRRLLQAKWRIKMDAPIGKYKSGENMVALGNLLEKKYAVENGANFLTSKIKKVVEDVLDKQERGAKIEKNRLYTNMLSSQPLAFNLFGELSIDLVLASKVFNDLFPERVKQVKEIKFEHSPGRGSAVYTADHSAFDVFVKYDSLKGKSGFIAIEVKYVENMKDKPSTHKPRYEELWNNSKIFKTDSLEILKQKPIQQIWRDHLLSIATLKDYDEGFFVFLYPSQNVECTGAVEKYKETLRSDVDVESGFYPKHIEQFCSSIRKFTQSKWIGDFEKRYLGE